MAKRREKELTNDDMHCFFGHFACTPRIKEKYKENHKEIMCGSDQIVKGFDCLILLLYTLHTHLVSSCVKCGHLGSIWIPLIAKK